MAGWWQTLKQLLGLETAGATPSAPPPPQPRSFAEEFRATAKASDDARKAKFRAHAERPEPPWTAEDRAAIATAKESCLAIRHVFPPRHPQRSMSFFGGAPLAPDSFDPPRIHNVRGLLEPLTFMAQVDLGALPDGPARSLLPRDGYLYFFAPMSGAFDEIALRHVVRYVPGKARKTWGPQSFGPAAPVMEVENARHVFPWVNWRPDPRRYYPTSLPRVEIELGWLEQVGEVEEGDPDAGEGFPWEVAEKRQQEAVRAFHGEPPAFDPLLDDRGKPVDQLWVPFEGFPINKRAAEILTGFVKTWLGEEEAALDEALRRPHQEFALRHSAALSLANIPTTEWARPLTDTQRAQVLALLEDLRAGRGPEPVVERIHRQDRLPRVVNRWIATAAVEAVEAALADPEAAPSIPPHVVEALRYRHAGPDGRHQLFGRGVVVQSAADELADDYVLLLQLAPNAALGLARGEMGPLQYWIHPADLRERRFEHTFLTIEAY